MQKIQVYGTYPDLKETAKRLGLSDDEVESVRQLTRQLRKNGKVKTSGVRKRKAVAETQQVRAE